MTQHLFARYRTQSVLQIKLKGELIPLFKTTNLVVAKAWPLLRYFHDRIRTDKLQHALLDIIGEMVDATGMLNTVFFLRCGEHTQKRTNRTFQCRPVEWTREMRNITQIEHAYRGQQT